MPPGQEAEPEAGSCFLLSPFLIFPHSLTGFPISAFYNLLREGLGPQSTRRLELELVIEPAQARHAVKRGVPADERLAIVTGEAGRTQKATGQNDGWQNDQREKDFGNGFIILPSIVLSHAGFALFARPAPPDTGANQLAVNVRRAGHNAGARSCWWTKFGSIGNARISSSLKP